ncbi:MAG TPA: hypothetical protein VMW50_08010 [Dehalococcoidia bacterium]|jgi:hypothetical protein|nr:hypothetical protein [Dehalococcoidia bacterium]
MEIKIIGDSDEINAQGNFDKEIILSNDSLANLSYVELYVDDKVVALDLTQLYVATKAFYEQHILEEQRNINIAQINN